jgi:hypothetical protein
MIVDTAKAFSGWTVTVSLPVTFTVAITVAITTSLLLLLLLVLYFIVNVGNCGVHAVMPHQ